MDALIEDITNSVLTFAVGKLHARHRSPGPVIGKITNKSLEDQGPCLLLTLPPEIRILIYTYYILSVRLAFHFERDSPS